MIRASRLRLRLCPRLRLRLRLRLRPSVCLSLCAALVPGAVAQQRPIQGSGGTKRYEPEDPHEEMQYTVFTPSGMDKGRLYPLMMVAHGTAGQAWRYCRRQATSRCSSASFLDCSAS